MTIVIGLFVGWIEVIAIVIAGLVVPPEHIGLGSALFASIRAVTRIIMSKYKWVLELNAGEGH